MSLEFESTIAIAGIAISTIIAIIGLFLNASAVRKNNRIAVSTKLVEGSKLLSDELTSRCRSYQLYVTELKEAETHSDSPEKAKKIEVLNELIQKSLQRQNEIDGHLEEIQGLFSKLDEVDPGIIDSAIARSYGLQTLAASSFDLANEIKNKK